MARRQGAPLALRSLALLLLAGCAKPYEPACRADAPTRLGEPSFELQLRAGGEVSAGRSRLLFDDAGVATGRDVTVQVHAWDGKVLREVSGTFEQPGDDSFGLRSSFGTERDGALWRLRIRGQPDGGQSAVWLETSDAAGCSPARA